MSCGCGSKKIIKSKDTIENKEFETYKNFNFEEETSNPKVLDFIVKNFIKIAAFSLALLLLPIIMIAVIWFMFQLLVLNQEIDMRKIALLLTSKLRRFNEDYEEDEEYDDDDDDDEYDEEEYESLDVEEITPSPIK